MACVEWTWEGLVAKCKRIHQTYAPDIEIPSTYAPDVLQVFYIAPRSWTEFSRVAWMLL